MIFLWGREDGWRKNDRMGSMSTPKHAIKTFYIESLGCAKNSVDSRSMAELLDMAGYEERFQPEESDLIIVNTCGFIQPAREESLQMLRDFAAEKRPGQYLVAAGCLGEREKQQLAAEVQGLDAALGTRRWSQIVAVVDKLRQPGDSPYFYFPPTERIVESDEPIVRAALQGSSAYLKIADGCDRGCAFCAIPLIKGPMFSRPIPEIVADAQALAEAGAKEIILIAQDTTTYGHDLGMKDGLAALLKELSISAAEIPWVRVMYTFPGMHADPLIELMAGENNILPYLDMPLQHAHPDVLKRMRRPSDMNWVRRTLEKFRDAIPDVALRTTFIVGFPGETEAEFQELLNFTAEVRFDHVGIFPYYHEADTPAFALEDSVPDAVKEDRIQRLAALQEDISHSRNEAWVGREMDVLIEGVGDGLSVGRSFRDAPEIDGLVLLDEVLDVDELVRVRVNGALTHDLMAEKI
ncbi:MAG: ribosomal protein methylthiotransferase [Chloroflexota bacterium]|nr:ribosomal protein methylthiotransferase [Chloroflexota bacterium]